MASEKLKLCNFEIKNFRRDYGIVIPEIIMATTRSNPQEIWLQIGKVKHGEIELVAGFADIKPGGLRRGPLVEKIDGEYNATRRTAWWIRMQDIEDVWFYDQAKK